MIGSDEFRHFDVIFWSFARKNSKPDAKKTRDTALPQIPHSRLVVSLALSRETPATHNHSCDSSVGVVGIGLDGSSE